MKRKRRKVHVERAVIDEAQRILAIPWGTEAVDPSQQRAAARALGISRYLPDPQQPLKLPRAA